MKRITRVFKDLMTPDDQAQSWYGWATNQMSHAFLGAIISAIIGIWGVAVVAVIAIAKEGFDIFKGAKFIDSALDVAFWLLGAFAVSTEHLSWMLFGLIGLAIILAIGIRDRLPR